MEINLSDAPFILAGFTAITFIAYSIGYFLGWRFGKTEATQEMNEILNQINR